jgi:hypothetical protein
MSPHKILVVRMGGGYWRAILRFGEEVVFGADLGELIGRLKTRASVLPVPPKYVGEALEIIRR